MWRGLAEQAVAVANGCDCIRWPFIYHDFLLWASCAPYSNDGPR